MAAILPLVTTDREGVRGNALIEPFFLQVEHQVGRLLRELRHDFYTMLVHLIDRFVPWFRTFTKRFETRLVSILRTLKGKREINYLGKRRSMSEYVEDLREHTDNMGDGKIE